MQGGHGKVGFLAGPRSSRNPPVGPSGLRAVQDYDAKSGGPSSGSSPGNGEGDRPDDDGEVQSKRPLDGIDVLGFDEIAAGKGQSYWTLICAPEGTRGPELLHIVEGRKAKDLTPF